MTNKNLLYLSTFLAIAITTTMDSTGLSVFSALPLAGLLLLFWLLAKPSRQAMGFTFGKPKDYLLALAYPVLVIGLCITITLMLGGGSTDNIFDEKNIFNFVAMTLSTVIMATITEEGFFRGWLWHSLSLETKSDLKVLIYSSIIFSMWHVSAVSLDTGFDLPAAQIPVYLINAVFMGMGWGLLRLISGSVVVASVSHGLWNGLAYVLFGFGDNNGALNIVDTAIYGVEVGIIGTLINGLIVCGSCYYFLIRKAHSKR